MTNDDDERRGFRDLILTVAFILAVGIVFAILMAVIVAIFAG